MEGRNTNMSKANQFAKNEEAVSPVIGVILMVAITVVLAAVVFVLVSNLSKNSNTAAPNITFNQDNAGHTLTIVSADAAANWQNVKGSISGGSSCTYTLRSGATTSAATVMTTGSAAVAAGDTITVSGSSGSSCVLSLTYTTVNQLLGSWTFTF
jgi:flagellin-like protein